MGAMPKMIGRYRVESKLGEGSMSVVYKAHDSEIDRSIAIKLLRSEVMTEPEYRSRFISEAKAAGNLTHPNIVTIHDVGECKAGPYIAMELLDGPTLEDLLREQDDFDCRRVLSIGIQLAEALDYSHAKGVVHRDVKPGNIILQRERDTLRITDFGIARVESPDTMVSTIAGTILGTPQYMSPEQVEGEVVDGRSDLFSVGVILYQLITGMRPFSANTLASLYLQILSDDPLPIDSQAPAAPVGLRNAIKKLLNKEPERRFQSGSELADALRKVEEELNAREQRQAEARLMPLRYKWTLVLVLLVSLSMAIASAMIYRKEINVMTTLALDFGSSLAEFVAAESAESMVIQDWVAMELYAQETVERQQISHLQIVDRDGIVRGSAQAKDQGKPYAANPGAQYVTRNGETVIHRLESAHASLFDFEVPILYQKRGMGWVHLGLSSDSLDHAAQVTLYTMIGLMLAVILTVAVVAYLLAARLSAPMRILHNALKQAAQGNLAHRITESRNDELGRMFDQYNRMVESMDKLHEDHQALSQTTTVRGERPLPADLSEADLDPEATMLLVDSNVVRGERPLPAELSEVELDPEATMLLVDSNMAPTRIIRTGDSDPSDTHKPEE